METPEDFQDQPVKRRPPATTPQGRENQMISLAIDQAEMLLREGKAPVPIVVHYLKMATEKEKLERERIRSQIALDHKKAENIETAAQIGEMFEAAKKAMLTYQGRPSGEDDDPEDVEYYD